MAPENRHFASIIMGFCPGDIQNILTSAPMGLVKERQKHKEDAATMRPRKVLM